MLNKASALSDDMLEAVSGGSEIKEGNNNDKAPMRICDECTRRANGVIQYREFEVHSGGTAYCKTCGTRSEEDF